MAMAQSGVAALFRAIDRPAWIRFFGALAGLSLAFASAMLSTVFRTEGNLWATAISASLALLLAGAVAILTVPYLARRVIVVRVRDAFDYDITREGAGYLMLVMIIGIAALNTGNNLLFIVVSAMLAAILISGVASAALLRAMELEVSLPAHVFARRPAWAQFRLRNRRRWAPAFSLNVIPAKREKKKTRRSWERGVFTFPPEAPPEKQWLRLPDLVWRAKNVAATSPQIFSGTVYFPYVGAGASAMAEIELTFDRRGRYAQDTLGLSTRFPFSFLVKTRRVKLAREVLVYPPVDETDELLEILPMITGEFEVFVHGRGHDLYRIRDQMPGDPARHVDWKASAKAMSLKVREFTREDERRLRIVFDNPA